MSSFASEKVQTLQGLRALAALLVVFQHSVLTIIGSAAESDSPFYGIVVSTGDIGVFLFFAISGFIMMYTSRNSFGESGAPLRFVAKRLLRIVPLYWLAMSIYALKLAAQQNPPSWLDILKSFAFIPYQDANGFFHPVYPLGWTLNYEMLFYAIFALSLVVNYRLATVFIMSLMLSLVAVGQLLVIDQSNPIAFYYTQPIILYFALGIIAFFAFDALKSKKLFEIRNGRRFALILLIGAIAPSMFASLTGSVLPVYAVFLVVFLLLAYAAIGRPSGNWDSLTWRLVLLLGEASFSIYLTHSFVLGPMGRIWNALQVPDGLWWLFCAGAVSGAAVFGILTHRFVELPLTQLVRKFFLRRKSISGVPVG